MKKFLVIFLLSTVTLVAQSVTYKADSRFNVNKISTFHYNNNRADFYLSGNSSGFIFPKGSNKSPIYASGFIWGGKIDGQILVGGSTYNVGLQPGRINPDGTAEPAGSPITKIWRVRPDYLTANLSSEIADGEGTAEQIRARYQEDWNNWPVDRGAPFEDKNNNGQYEPSIDIPGVKGAAQTIWYVCNDKDNNLTNALYGSPSMGIELQVTIWGFATDGVLDGTTFRKYKLINKNPSQKNITDMYLSLWSDPDVGSAGDDFVGCDSTLSLGFAYNGRETDAIYGDQPPAVGYLLVQGPIIQGTPSDTAYYNFGRRIGKKNLPMSSFYFFTQGDAMYTDPQLGNYTNGTLQFYNLLQGKVSTTGQPFTDPLTGKTTKFPLAGDPLYGTGWIDGILHQPNDRRLGSVTGPFSFAYADTQEVVYAIIAEEGVLQPSSNLQSVQRIKNNSSAVQNFYKIGLITSFDAEAIYKTGSSYVINSTTTSVNPNEVVNSYKWELLNKPNGSTFIIVTSNLSSVDFVPDIEGIYKFSLTITTSLNRTLKTNIDLFATSNREPAAQFTLASSEVTFGDYVYADATGSSDPDNDPLFYNWSVAALDQNSTAGGKYFQFRPIIVGSNTVSLTVKDNLFSSQLSKTFTVNPKMQNITKDYSYIDADLTNMQRNVSFVKDNLLFVTPNGENRVLVYEIQNNALVKIKTLIIPNVAGVSNYLNGRLYVMINTPYVAVYGALGYLSIYSVDNDWAITPLLQNWSPSVVPSDFISSIIYFDTYVLMMQNSNNYNYYKYDLYTNPASPQFISTLQITPIYFNGRSFVNNKIYFGYRDINNKNYIDIIRISDFQLEKTVPLDTITGWTYNSLTPNYFYANLKDSLVIYNVDPNFNLTKVKQISITPPFEITPNSSGYWKNLSTHSASVYSNNLIGISAYGGRVLYDISNVQNPVQQAYYFSNSYLPFYLNGKLLILPSVDAKHRDFEKFGLNPLNASQVTFSLDVVPLINSGIFNPLTDRVYVKGNFSAWENIQLFDPDKNGIYNAVLQLTQNQSYQYKYSISSLSKKYNSSESIQNRVLNTGSQNSITLSTHFFNNVSRNSADQWTNYVGFSDTANKYVYELGFGVISDATDSIDIKYGENLLPPISPSEVMDIRFTLPTGGDESSLFDYRNNSNQSLWEWTIKTQYNENSLPITITWDNQNLPFGIFRLIDTDGGNKVNVDMKNQSSYVLDQTGISQLKIQHVMINGLSIQIFDNGGMNKTLEYGFSPSATDGIDAGLGESLLPPAPPTGIFDARFVLPNETDASLKDFRKDEQDSVTWTIIFQPSGSGYPFTFLWDKNTLPDGSFILTDAVTGTVVKVDMKTTGSYTLTNTGIKTLLIKYSKTVNANVTLSEGWNIISVPVKVPNMNTTVLFPDNTSSTYSYDNGYKIVTALENGAGYWLKYKKDTTLVISGEKINLTTVPVKNGWNLIGPYDWEVLVSGISTTPSGLISSQFYEYKNGYIVPTKLLPGKGYWIKVSADGVLNLPSASGSPAALAKQTDEVSTDELQKEGLSISVVDALGRSAQLRLLNEVGTIERYDLPPLPPKGIYEVRWSSDRKIEKRGEGTREIVINSAEYPVILTVTGGDVKIKDNVGGQVVNQILRKGESLRITNRNIERLTIEELEIPTEFALLQNYPNPFNPETKIEYWLPEKGKVMLKIYDVLGREVETLVDLVQEAGKYEVRWRALNYSSGVYFYNIITGSNHSVKKMLLVK